MTELRTDDIAPEPSSQKTKMGDEMRKLSSGSLIFLVPTILARGLNFLLLPLFTRVLTTEDYGITSVAMSVQMLLTTVLGFGVHASTFRLHYQWKTEEERRVFYGSILIFLTVVPALILAALYGAGTLGVLDHVFVTLRFHPHLALVIGIAYFALFQAVPPNILMIREMSLATSIYNLVNFLTTLGAMIVFVVVLQQGALGQLRAALVGNIIVAIISVGVILRFAKLSFSWAFLREALVFGIPLVPHFIATWGLGVSDRLVLERYVSAEDLGCYSLAYTFNAITVVIVSSIGRALQPMLTRKLSKNDGAEDVPRLGTLALFAVVVIALPAAMFAREAVIIITPPSYHAAAKLVPWLTLSVVFQAMYQTLTQGTYQSKNTKGVPVVTFVALLANIGLNLLMAPYLGTLAAAINTAVAYVLLAVLHGRLAHKLHPISWEYGRWAKLLICAVGTFLAGSLADKLPISASIPLKLFIFSTFFPGLLVISGYATHTELVTLGRGVVSSLKNRLQGRVNAG